MGEVFSLKRTDENSTAHFNEMGGAIAWRRASAGDSIGRGSMTKLPLRRTYKVEQISPCHSLCIMNYALCIKQEGSHNDHVGLPLN